MSPRPVPPMPLFDCPKDVDPEAIRLRRPDKLAVKQELLLDAITPNKVKGAKLSEITAAFAALHKAESIDLGKPTEISGLASASSDLKRLIELEKQLRERLVAAGFERFTMAEPELPEAAKKILKKKGLK